MRRLVLAAWMAITGWAVVGSAQFGNIFEQMFGGQQMFGHAGQQQQQQQQAPYQPGEWYQYHYENTDCSNYLCPETLQCVAQPRDCPCAFPEQQTKCRAGMDHYICVNHDPAKRKEACAAVDAALHLKS